MTIGHGDLLLELHAAGLPVEQIARILNMVDMMVEDAVCNALRNAGVTPDSVTQERTREKTAERVRRYRERQAALQSVTPSVTGVTKEVLPPKEVPPDPPKKLPLSPEKPPSPPTGATSPQVLQAKQLAQEFEVFWAAWPEKKARGGAARAFPAARRKATLEAILAGVPNVTETHAWLGGKHVLAQTWLNQERWLDEPDLYERTVEATPGMIAAATEKQAINELVARYQREEDERNGTSGEGRDRLDYRGAGLALPSPQARQG